jgi:hypothetical protein
MDVRIFVHIWYTNHFRTAVTVVVLIEQDVLQPDGSLIGRRRLCAKT